jgi:hypothetical protein
MAKSYHKNNLAKARNSRHYTEETESGSDCGYEGGVDCDPSDTELNEDWSDAESLAELEGDELEANLSALRKEAEFQDAPNAFKQMMSHSKNSKEWKKVEANRALGYTKNSIRTQERRRKEAREQEASQAGAETS